MKDTLLVNILSFIHISVLFSSGILIIPIFFEMDIYIIKMNIKAMPT